MIIVNDIILNINETEGDAVKKAASLISLAPSAIKKSFLVKISVDARRKNNLRLVCTVGFCLLCNEEEFAQRQKSAKYIPQTVYAVTRGTKQIGVRPIVVGFGPAGMFAALLLARNGYKPLVLERGESVSKRIESVKRYHSQGILDTESNIQFGEGGAGTFSDGKLTTRTGDPRCREVLKIFCEHSAPEEILTRAKPHLGTDNLRWIVKSIREEIISLGGEVRFNTKAEKIELCSGSVSAVWANGERIPAQTVILAPGHSARDTFTMLHNCGLTLVPKPFSVGVRAEHLQSEVDRALYGKYAGSPLLPHAEYQLSLRKGDEAVYTFCMCPGGRVVAAASEQDTVVTNGMSDFSRSKPNANSAVVVSVGTNDFGNDVFSGMEFCRDIERRAFILGGKTGAAPFQTAGNFLSGKGGAVTDRVNPSYLPGVCEADFRELFSPRICKMLRSGIRAFGAKQEGFSAPDTVLTGAETRTSSPVRILRGEDMSATLCEGLYPCGEGAGYAGGIMTAAVDGMKAAEKIIGIYAPYK